jgi:hypothetical protein
MNSGNSIHKSAKIAVSGPDGVLMIEPPFAGYDLDPNLFADLIDPPVFETNLNAMIPLDISTTGSSGEYVKIETKDHAIRAPPFLECRNGRVFEPNALEEIGVPIVRDGMNPMLHLIAVRAYALQVLADNLGLVNIYLAALALYKLGLDIANGGEPIVGFIQRNFAYCLLRGDTLCTGDEESEASAARVIYARAVELASAAGENEMAGHSYAGCLIAYEQGIVLLEALLDVGEGDEEREGIERLVKGLYTRVESVREKMNV